MAPVAKVSKVMSNVEKFNKKAGNPVPTSNFGKAEERHKYYSQDGRYIYHIAIIDYLTDFNMNKVLENWFKVNILRRDSE